MIVLNCFKKNDFWYFSDIMKKINNEPFLFGLSKLITKIAKDKTEVKVCLSTSLIKGFNKEFIFEKGLTRINKPEYDSAWYKCDGKSYWFTNKQLSYFSEIPQKFYLKVQV